jgi:CubicO group peptidase (beta-lactamase class C family)
MAFQFDRRQIRLGLAGFFLVFVFSLLSIKPYLPAAIYHNFATLYDYQFFHNRPVKVASATQPLPQSSFKIVDPPEKTLALIRDLKTTALLVLQEGAVIYEKYSEDGGADVLSGSFSMAKSIVALLTGFALEEGRIKSLDERVERYLPEWEGLDEGKITLRNLLQMTSGLNWDESYMNPLSITTEAYYGSDLHFTALRQRLIRPPGSGFSYQSGTTQLLGLVVARAVNKNLADYASEKLWRPLGAEKEALWSLDKEDGMEKAYCCFNATARDFARVGEFVRNFGKWNGQQLLSEAYIKEMIHPHGVPDKDGKATDYYGYQWWVYHTLAGDVPYARGILGQYIIVLPQRNRVIVRLGKKTAERVDHHPIEVRELVEWGLRN